MGLATLGTVTSPTLCTVTPHKLFTSAAKWWQGRGGDGAPTI
jgi:hypothetical protein